MNDKKVPFHAPLNPGDTENQTIGCRANNPDICLGCLTSSCAFSNKEGICYRPSIKWKKQYNKLKSEEKKDQK